MKRTIWIVGGLAALGIVYYMNRPKVSDIKISANTLKFTFLGKRYAHTLFIGAPTTITDGSDGLTVRDWGGGDGKMPAIEFRISKDGQFVKGFSLSYDEYMKALGQ